MSEGPWNFWSLRCRLNTKRQRSNLVLTFYRRYTVRETDNADLKSRTKYKQFQIEMRLTNKNIQSQITFFGFYKKRVYSWEISSS